MIIEYKNNSSLQATAVSALFKSSGIKRPAEDLARIQKMIDNADVTITAWEGERLIGMARAITDYSYCCYLSDLAVCKEYQKMGIGRELVERLRNHLGEEVSLVLLSSPIAIDYYPRIGFDKTDKAFVIPRVK